MEFFEMGRLVRRSRPLLLGLAVAGLWSGSAGAFEIPTGNPDLDIRWDQTIKYNAGWRMEGRDRRLADAWQYQAGEYQFGRGDMVTNRFDLLSEFDFVYKQLYGFRVSGAAWNDFAYDKNVSGNPAFQAHPPTNGLCATVDCRTAYPNNRFVNNVSRYYTRSAEFLDAFIFARVFEGENSNADVKAGRHMLFWGEALYSPIHGVSYSQGPVDFRKSLATPGSEAKELFLPLNQISAHINVNERLSFAGQYYLEWKPYRIYEGGTYFTYADPFFQAGTTLLGRPFDGDASHGPFKHPDGRGDWGVNVKYDAGDFGTVGLYYRRFDDKVMAIVGDATRMVCDANGANCQSTLTNAYAKNVKLYGVSFSKMIEGVSIGSEIVRRENTALGTVTGNNVGLARGDTWHALVNATASFSKNMIFDSAILAGELTYSRLDKVYASSDPMTTFKAVGYNCAPAPQNNDGTGRNGTKDDGCATKDAWGLNLNFTQNWFQAIPGTDLSLLMHYDRGLKGNSPVPFGGNENSGSWSIKLTATYLQDYSFSLAYTDYFGTYTAADNYAYGQNGIFATPGISNTVVNTTNGGNAVLHDRGWLSFTFKTNF